MVEYRTDEHNNPAAFTTDIAKMARLQEGIDYEIGAPFKAGASTYFTAKLLKDPVATTIQVIDHIGFYTTTGHQRWIYIGIPYVVWYNLTSARKRDVIGFMYGHEGGVTMRHLFPNYGKVK